jgi:hypothetical protein
MGRILYDFIKQSNRLNNDENRVCYFSSLKYILHYYGNDDLTYEGILFVLLNGLNVTYDKKFNLFGYDYEDINNLALFNGKYINDTKLYNLFGSLADFILHKLYQDEPVLCFVNTKYLNYHSVYVENENQVHAIIVYGISENNECNIFDPHIRINSDEHVMYKGTIPYSILSRALIGIWEVQKKRYLFSKQDVYQKLIDSLHFYLMDHNKPPYKGLIAIHKYIEDKTTSIQEKDQDTFLKECINYYYNLKINGPISALYFLGQVGMKLEISAHTISNLNQMINEWEGIMHQILISGYKYSNNKLVYFKNQSDTLLKSERIVIEHMLDELVSLVSSSC